MLNNEGYELVENTYIYSFFIHMHAHTEMPLFSNNKSYKNI